MEKKRGSVGTDALCLVAMGIFANTITSWVAYGNLMIVGGVGLLLFEVASWYKSKFDKLFLNCGLYIVTDNGQKLIPKLIKKQKHPTKTEYIFTLPPGMELQNFRAKHGAIYQNIRKPVSFAYHNGVIIMTVKEELKSQYPFKLIHYDEPLKVCFGYSSEGPFTFDIEEAVHTIIGGSTGWGKSVLLRILAVILLHKPIELHLVDFMRVEMGIFKKHKNVKSFSKTPEEFSYLLDDLEEICDKRLKMFEKKNISGIKSWNKKHTPLKYIVVLIDEFAAIAKDKTLQSKFETATAQFRKVGIHFIATTQRCSVDIINGTIKNNMNTRISFKLSSDTDSRVVLDEGGAENLKYKGRCLIKTNELTECQVMYLDEDGAREIVYGKE